MVSFPKYRCPVCGDPDPWGYLDCPRPDCMDGRDLGGSEPRIVQLRPAPLPGATAPSAPASTPRQYSTGSVVLYMAIAVVCALLSFGLGQCAATKYAHGEVVIVERGT